MFYYFDPDEGYLRSVVFDAFISDMEYTSDPRFAMEGDAEFFELMYKLNKRIFHRSSLIPIPDYE